MLHETRRAQCYTAVSTCTHIAAFVQCVTRQREIYIYIPEIDHAQYSSVNVTEDDTVQNERTDPQQHLRVMSNI